ncbi:substrate-binding protein [Siccirubricoccus deserti]|uniref:ABC transporter substrate-binding protein n=1 Tax=Siccirubricoccus deserti TaxID=2013562 RepID=A0A9X0UDZ5_9PROT|nr:ABC transporter substrate-binding protein [Siccirubricoccus deserti]MBC4016241.1 ABC transporter substrate-binding protein [Siccirubricoccus deserti]GGC48304.1 substrate-binding protein [Siccirubricoccus deserti]
MRRRSLLATGAAAFAAPRLAAAQGAPGRRVLRFVPQADLALLDPIHSVAFVTRNHALMVYDTLYGWDADLRARPQMAEGHSVEDNGRTVTIRLREGLRFHDGEPVRGRDAAASVRRWASRDAFGQALWAVTDEVSAPDDRSIRFRLKKPFPLLPDALAKVGTHLCAIMPERHATLPSSQAVPEIIGSGPYRYLTGERVPGSRNIYARNEAYVPRSEPAAYMSGGKQVHFDRVEWLTIPDAATASAALQRGEVDWWELPSIDLVPQLRRSRGVKIDILDPNGSIGFFRPNCLHPPFDNPAIRRVVLRATQQRDFMIAAASEDQSFWRVPYGFFAPPSVMASDEGMEILRNPVDHATAKRELEAAGYKGERVTFLAATDFPVINAMCEVQGDLLRKIGINLDYVATDWGTVVQRILKQDPPAQGGWNAVVSWTAGSAQVNPAANNLIRGHGRAALFGWPEIPALETLRNSWFEAADEATQARIGREMQRIAFDQVPYVPLGQFFSPTALRGDLEGMLKGVALFYGIRRA